VQREEIVSWGAQPLSVPFLPSINRTWMGRFPVLQAPICSISLSDAGW
jgi:hypothetical protein